MGEQIRPELCVGLELMETIELFFRQNNFWSLWNLFALFTPGPTPMPSVYLFLSGISVSEKKPNLMKSFSFLKGMRYLNMEAFEELSGKI